MWPFKRKLKILSFGDLKTGCWVARIKRPLEELAKLGHKVVFTDGSAPVKIEGWDIVIFNNLMAAPELMNGDVEERDSSIVEMLNDFREHGAKIVYDTDDAQDIIPDHIVNKEVYENIRKSFYTFIENADLITTTTPTIAEYLAKKTDKPVKILPNCLNIQDFPPREHSETLRIGFVGSPSHVNDLAMVVPYIKKLKSKYDFQFVVMGLPSGMGKWIKPVSALEYPRKIAELGLDIALAPLEDSDFNRNKSCIKFYEMASVGTLLIASNVLPYSGELKKEWLTDNDKWYDKLEELILNKELRVKLQREQQEWVRENRDMSKECVQWEEAYKNLIKSK